MTKTKIEWATDVWNPVTGCSKVSQGCKNCYAERMAMRLKEMGHANYRNGFEVTLQPHMLELPLRWKKPRRVFVNSMSDLFHKDIPVQFVRDVFAVMGKATQHKFMILTKRPERMHTLLESYTPYPNVWLGVSVEDQKTADERIPLLLQTPAAVRFVSCEPMLGAVDLWRFAKREETFGSMYDHRGTYEYAQMAGFPSGSVKISEGIDWVICGGESGPHARPMHPDWARSLRDQCQVAGVPFFFKQWGEWVPKDHYLPDEKKYIKNWGCLNRSGDYFEKTSTWNGRQGDPDDDYEVSVYKVGKAVAGRVLDGRTWEEYP